MHYQRQILCAAYLRTSASLTDGAERADFLMRSLTKQEKPENFTILDIDLVVNQALSVLSLADIVSSIAVQNLHARLRLTLTYLIAQSKANATGARGHFLVVGTGNSDEMYY